jgi:hypothetical protein
MNMKSTKLFTFILVVILAVSMLMTLNFATAANPEEEVKAEGTDVTIEANPTTTDWIPDQRVSNTANNEYNPSITTDGSNNLWVAYDLYNPSTTLYEIKVARSTDGGVTWALMYTYAPGKSVRYPSIAADAYNNYIYVVFEYAYSASDTDIYLARNNGTGWYIEPINTSTADDHSPSIVCEYNWGSTNYVFTTWERRYATYTELWFAKSTDHGDTWTSSKIDGGPGAHTHQPSIAYAATTVYVAYRFEDLIEPGTPQGINVLVSNSEGNSWLAAENLYLSSTYDVGQPTIAATHGASRVVVAWMHYTTASNTDIRYSYSTDSGANWNGAYTLASSADREYSPHLTVDGMGGTTDYVKDICIVYAKYETVGSRYNGLYYTRTNFAAPTSWSTPVQVMDDNGALSYSYPALADRSITTRHGDKPVVVWCDYRADYDIYATTMGGYWTVDTFPSGLRVYVDGTYYTAPKQFLWAYGTQHRVYAPTTVGPHTFIKWSDGGAQDHYMVANTVNEALLMAYYTPTLTLNVSPNPVARGSYLTMSGQLTPGFAASISIYAKVGTAYTTWKKVATFTTTAAGSFSKTAYVGMSNPANTYYLCAVWFDSTTNQYAQSNVVTLVIT